MDVINANANATYLLTNGGTSALSTSTDFNATGAAIFKNYVDIVDTINDDASAIYLLTGAGESALETSANYNSTAAAAYKNAFVQLHSLCDDSVDLYCPSSNNHPDGTGTGDSTSLYHICAQTWSPNGLEYAGWVDANPATPAVFDCTNA